MNRSLMVIEDEEILRKALHRFLSERGFEVMTFSDWEEAMPWIRNGSIELLLIDLMLPRITGIEVIRRFRETNPDLVSIVMTGFGTIPSAIEAIRSGAFHYITKPFDLEDLLSLIQKAFESIDLQKENKILREQLKEKLSENIVGQNIKMKEVFQLIEKVAPSDSTVLILGESGTGKELLAKSIHYQSPRADKPFVAVNCAAIPEGLLESELFGHIRGAFTDATQNRMGKFEMAHGGTVFLDEVGDMSPRLQVKVLRALQERCFEAVGSSKTKEVDIRIIAATNQDLTKLVHSGRFREDLYYRLNVIPLFVPPLRERPDDIPLLIDHFIEKHNRQNHKNVKGVTSQAQEILSSHYFWPGNVRELENLIERLVIFKSEGRIGLEDLPMAYLPDHDLHFSRFFSMDFSIPEAGVDFRLLTEKFAWALIEKALYKTGGNKNRAAQLLKLNRTTLLEKMKKGQPNV